MRSPVSLYGYFASMRSGFTTWSESAIVSQPCSSAIGAISRKWSGSTHESWQQNFTRASALDQLTQRPERPAVGAFEGAPHLLLAEPRRELEGGGPVDVAAAGSGLAHLDRREVVARRHRPLDDRVAEAPRGRVEGLEPLHHLHRAHRERARGADARARDLAVRDAGHPAPDAAEVAEPLPHLRGARRVVRLHRDLRHRNLLSSCA